MVMSLGSPSRVQKASVRLAAFSLNFALHTQMWKADDKQMRAYLCVNIHAARQQQHGCLWTLDFNSCFLKTLAGQQEKAPPKKRRKLLW
jgi:hypothetical protein